VLHLNEIDFLSKTLQIDSLASLLWGLVTRIQIPASLNHPKVKQAEPVT